MISTAEQLTTGWEPEAPVDDTLLRRVLFHQAPANSAFAVPVQRLTLWVLDREGGELT